MIPREAYEAAFEKERAIKYPAIDAFEQEMGYFVPILQLEVAARILACPVKRHHPCWQHGRVIYALARRYLSEREGIPRFIDIGTAKGFSALMMAWAVRDAGRNARISSFDVLDPSVPGYRNSIADCDGPKTLAQYLEPWPEAQAVGFWGCPATEWLERNAASPRPARINFAFVDGKHSTEVVTKEAGLIAERQIAGDIILFDDLQMLPVRKAVGRLRGYDMRLIQAAADRAYMMATKQ